MAKTPALKPPSVDSINLVLQAASSAPLQNMQHAAALGKALAEVEGFFKAMLEPQASGGRASGSTPQASATAAGNPSAQG